MGQDLYLRLLEEKRLQGWAEVQREEPLSQAVFDEELVLTGSFSTASRSRARVFPIDVPCCCYYEETESIKSYFCSRWLF